MAGMTLERKNTLQLPNQGSLEYLSPDDHPANGGPRLSMASINSQNRRVSVMSTGSRRSNDSNEYRRNSSMSGGVPDQNIPVDVDGENDEEKDAAAKINSNDSYIREMIPTIPMSWAITCLILNIFIPGTGSALSGILAVCLKEKAEPTSKTKDVSSIVCVNLWVGISQLGTITFLLVGWFWSLAWGVYLVQNAMIENEKKKKEEERQRETKLKQKALSMLMGGAVAAAAAAAANKSPRKTPTLQD